MLITIFLSFFPPYYSHIMPIPITVIDNCLEQNTAHKLISSTTNTLNSHLLPTQPAYTNHSLLLPHVLLCSALSHTESASTVTHISSQGLLMAQLNSDTPQKEQELLTLSNMAAHSSQHFQLTRSVCDSGRVTPRSKLLHSHTDIQ